MKSILRNHLRVFLLSLFAVSCSALSAQNVLTISASGQTGASGTNWSVSGNTLTVSGGAANIQASVITNHLQQTGNLTVVASGNITIDQSITTVLTSGRTLTFKSNADITVMDSRAITATGGAMDLVFWSDADATGGGMIYCKAGSSVSTNGGHLWMAGGAGSATWNGLTVGNGYARSKTVLSSTEIQQLNNQSQDYQNAITVDNSTINSGGGNIYLAGEASGELTAYSHIGVLIQRGSSIQSGAGSISITGISASIRNASGWYWGILLASDRSAEPNIIRSTSGAITILGEASTAYSFNHSGGIGIFEWQVGSMGINEISSVSGNILLDGNNKNASNLSYGGLVFSGGNATSRRVYNRSGDIMLTGRSVNAALSGIAISAGINVGYDGVNPCNGNITIRTNRLATLPAAARFQSTGELSIEPLTATTSIGIAGGTGTLALPAAYFSTNFVNGFSRINIGGSSQTGNMVIAAVSFNDDISLQTSGTVAQTGAISAAGQQLDMQQGNFTLTNAANNFAKLSGNVTAISFVNNGILEVKDLSASGTINLRAPNHAITISGNIASQSVSNTAVVIAAGSASAAGTTSGGNISITGTPSIAAGSGGSVRLYSGSLSGSSGLDQLVSADIGKLRYNTDITTSTFTPSLSSGVNILLRENGAIWRGSTTDFNTGLNWRDAAVPASGASIIIDPEATADLQLDASRTIGDLHFNGSNRVIILGNFDLTLNGVVTGADALNYIRTNGTGQLRKTIASSGSFTFSTGNSSFNPVTITNRTGATDEWRVRVLDEVYANGYSGTVATGKYVSRTWDIGKATANAGAGIDLVFSWNNGEASSSVTNAALYHYGTAWEKQTGTTSFTSTSLTYTGYTGSFSPFAIGDAAVILPVNWIDFSAKASPEEVLLNWKTAREENASHYIIQQSVDARNWTDLGVVRAIGNSQSVTGYTFIDGQPSAGNNYYRLLQVDINGLRSISKTISVVFGSLSSVIKIYPNPAINRIVSIEMAAAGDLQIFNAAGIMVMQRELVKGVQVISLQRLHAGTYFLKAGKLRQTIILP